MPSSSSTPTAHARRSSSSTSLGSSFQPEQHLLEADYDFCNAYWSTAQRRRDEVEDWGEQGYKTVLNRVKMGNKTLDELRSLFKDRIVMEEDYAKRLSKLSKNSFGSGETGHLERAVLQTKGEMEAMAKSHLDLAGLLKEQDGRVAEFIAKREGARKTQQMNVEKTWKMLGNQRAFVLKAKAKYEEDAISINALHAQASLLQGRDLDKATMKLDKAQQTVVVNKNEYQKYVGVLKETTQSWTMMWKTFCDLCQDQEEERLEFVKGRLWDWANALSTLAMAEDESAERTRTALEQCDPRTDIKLFVTQTGSGNSIPDPLPFVDFAQKQGAARQTYKKATFKRSSTRIPGMVHSPSAVQDITNAFHVATPVRSQSIAQQMQQQQQNDPRQAQQQNDPRQAQGRPPSRGATRSNSNLNLAASPSANNLPPSQETTPTRPKLTESVSGRFAVSPAANLRGPTDRFSTVTPTSASSQGGRVSASAFQQRSPSFSTPAEAPSRASAPPTAPSTDSAAAAPAPSTPSKAPAPEEEDDPILRALATLQNTPSDRPRPRSVVGHSPAPGAIALPGMSAPQHSRQSTEPTPRGPTHRQSQASLGRPDQFTTSPRPASPSQGPVVAAMMQPPAQSNSRPPSRQGSATGNRYSQPVAGIGARGRSPSPQPFQHPDALRPHSPAPNPRRSSSPQPGMQNGFTPAYPQQQQSTMPNSYGSQQFGSSQQLGAAPARAVSPRPHQQGMGSHPSQPSNMYASAPLQQQQQQFREPSPQPQQQFARPPSPMTYPGQQPYMSQAPSQPQLQQGVPQQQQQRYSQGPAVSHAPGYGPPAGYPASATPSQHAFAPRPHQGFTPQQPQQQQFYPSQNGAGAPPPQQGVTRASSTHSGVSNASQGSAQPHAQQQYAATPQQQQQRPASAMSQAAPAQRTVPPPTGQYTDDGKPILFYVNAIYDYIASSAEEFSFAPGDVIAVTATDPDGWWQGNKVGVHGGGHVFPSNFTELLE